MSNHPNRGRASGPAANPAPDAIRKAREAAGLTQRQAGALVYSERVWEAWESGRSRMHPAIWELWQIKAKQ